MYNIYNIYLYIYTYIKSFVTKGLVIIVNEE